MAVITITTTTVIIKNRDESKTNEVLGLAEMAIILLTCSEVRSWLKGWD